MPVLYISIHASPHADRKILFHITDIIESQPYLFDVRTGCCKQCSKSETTVPTDITQVPWKDKSVHSLGVSSQIGKLGNTFLNFSRLKICVDRNVVECNVYNF